MSWKDSSADEFPTPLTSEKAKQVFQGSKQHLAMTLDKIKFCNAV